jgi:HK97 family phage major capsid protein
MPPFVELVERHRALARSAMFDELKAIGRDLRSRYGPEYWRHAPPAEMRRAHALKDACEAQLAECRRVGAQIDDLIARDKANKAGAVARTKGIDMSDWENGADEQEPEGRGGVQVMKRVQDPWEIRTGLRAFNPGQLRDRAMAAVERTKDADDGGRQVITEMIERFVPEHEETTLAARWTVATSDPLYRSAFAKVLVDPQTGHREFTPEELAAFQRTRSVGRALQVGAGTSSAGLLAPYTLDPTWMLSSAGEIDPVRSLARVVAISGFEWRGVRTDGVVAHWRAESAEVDDDTPTLAQPVVRPERGDVFVPYSMESEQDVASLEESLRMAMTDARAVLEAQGWINGTGVANNQPEGLATALNDSASEVTPATAETFVVGDIYKTAKALPPRFRPNAVWLMDLATHYTNRNFAPAGSTTQPQLYNADETRLLGKPWHESTAMRSTDDIVVTATADNVILIYGDLKRAYVIVDRIGFFMEIVAHLLGANRRPTGERGAFGFWRTSGGVVNLNAVRGLNIETAA